MLPLDSNRRKDTEASGKTQADIHPDRQNKTPKEESPGFFFSLRRDRPADSVPLDSKRRSKKEVRNSAFGVGEPVSRAGAEAEWDVEDTEFVDELGPGGK